MKNVWKMWILLSLVMSFVGNAKEVSISASPLAKEIVKKLDIPKVDFGRPIRVVFGNDGYTPWYSQPGSEMRGLDIDMAHILCDSIENCTYSVQPFSTILDSIRFGKNDVGISGISIKPSRKRVVVFSTSYQPISSSLVTLIGVEFCKDCPHYINVDEPVDMENFKKALVQLKRQLNLDRVVVAVQANTVHQNFLETFRMSNQNYEYLDILPLDNMIDVQNALIKKQAVLAVGANIGEQLSFANSKLIGKVFGEGVGMVVANNSNKLRNQVDLVIELLAKHGFHDSLREYWNL